MADGGAINIGTMIGIMTARGIGTALEHREAIRMASVPEGSTTVALASPTRADFQADSADAAGSMAVVTIRQEWIVCKNNTAAGYR